MEKTTGDAVIGATVNRGVLRPRGVLPNPVNPAERGRAMPPLDEPGERLGEASGAPGFASCVQARFQVPGDAGALGLQVGAAHDVVGGGKRSGVLAADLRTARAPG